MEKITKAEAGAVVAGEVVKPACESKNDGRWYCVTHAVNFDNQLQKDSHIHFGKHKLAWLCYQHGFEQP